MEIPNLTHIGKAGLKALEYISGRRDGTITSLKTPWSKFNAVTLDGIEWNKIILWGGRSGSGKTLISEQLARELFDLNPMQAFAVLEFNFEMPSEHLQIRNIIGRLGIDVRTLLSANGNKLSEADLVRVKDYVENELNSFPIYYVEHPKTAEQYYLEVKRFYNFLKVPILVIADHTGLFKKSSSEKSAMEFLENLAQKSIELKKEIPCTQVILSQLNRDIEDPLRRTPKSSLNNPLRSDVRGGDGLYNAADLVVVTNSPYKLNFKGNTYTQDALSTNPEDIYWHFIKTRDGEEAVAKMTADFKNMRIIDRI